MDSVGDLRDFPRSAGARITEVNCTEILNSAKNTEHH
jgi:hypothetical protein